MHDEDVDIEYVWSPQPGPQSSFVKCPVPEILFGGARGGGKTDAVIGRLALHALHYGADANAVIFRKELPMADDLVERAKSVYCELGALWRSYDRTFTFPNGARIRLRPLFNVDDAAKYQGQGLSAAVIEEAGQFGSPEPIDRIWGALRSSAGVPVSLVLTANPGGPGQGWLRARFVDPHPLGNKVFRRELPNGDMSHPCVYIPSRLEHNRILLQHDPNYAERLKLVGSPELVRAWLEGDWSSLEGAFFPEFSVADHVIKPQPLPKHWMRFAAMDWGSYRPFCVLWLAVSDGTVDGIPSGALVVYREWYGSTGVPNVGLKMTAEAVADGIKERQREDGNIVCVADPSMFAEDGGPSLSEKMQRRGLIMLKADNTRVGKIGAASGWDSIRQRLIGMDDKPMIYFFSTTTNIIRTLPLMVHDPAKGEDLDTNAEDHACFAAGTLVDTVDGPRPIEDLDGWTAEVRTLDGRYAWAHGSLTRRAASVVRVTFEDGTAVTCTPDHRFLSIDGAWMPCTELTAATRSSNPLNVRSVEDAGRADVYCLTVPATGAFCIEGGIVVKNCDALRYGCLYRSWIKTEPPPTPQSDRWSRNGKRRYGGSWSISNQWGR
jgi:hypothetical protein